MNRRTRRTLANTTLGIALAVTLAVPRQARAGNDDEVLVGNHAAMMGGAVGSIVRDGSAAWYNPAGLGGLERDQIDASASVYTLRLYSASGYLTSTEGQQQDASVNEFLTVPAQLAYERRLAPNLGLGLAYFAPKSTNLLLREQLETGSPDDGSTWQLILAQADIQHRGVLAIGYEVLPGLRLGVSGVGGYETNTSTLSLFGDVTQDGSSRRVLNSSAVATYSRVTLEIGFGLQWEATPRLQLGVFGRSPTFQLRRRGETTIAQAEGRLDAGVPDSLVGRAQQVEPGEDVTLVKWGRLGFGFAYRLTETLLLSAEADVQPGIKSRDLAVSRDEVVNGRLGLYYQIRGALGVGMGLFSDRASDYVEPDDIATTGDFYGGTLGVELGERHFLDPTERARSLVFSTIIALRYAHSAAQTRRIIIDPSATAVQPFSSAIGTMQIHEISLYLGTGLAF